MEDKNMKFKTNINCWRMYVQSDTFSLIYLPEQAIVEVDTTNKDKILTVQGLDKSELK